MRSQSATQALVNLNQAMELERYIGLEKGCKATTADSYGVYSRWFKKSAER